MLHLGENRFSEQLTQFCFAEFDQIQLAKLTYSIKNLKLQNVRNVLGNTYKNEFENFYRREMPGKNKFSGFCEKPLETVSEIFGGQFANQGELDEI